MANDESTNWIQNISFGIGILVLASVGMATLSLVSLVIFVQMITCYDHQLLKIPPLCCKRKEVTGFRQEGQEENTNFLCQTKVTREEAAYQTDVLEKIENRLDKKINAVLTQYQKDRQAYPKELLLDHKISPSTVLIKERLVV